MYQQASRFVHFARIPYKKCTIYGKLNTFQMYRFREACISLFHTLVPICIITYLILLARHISVVHLFLLHSIPISSQLYTYNYITSTL